MTRTVSITTVDVQREEAIERAVQTARCALADLQRFAAEATTVSEALRLYYLIRDAVEQEALKAVAAALDRADIISESK